VLRTTPFVLLAINARLSGRPLATMKLLDPVRVMEVVEREVTEHRED